MVAEHADFCVAYPLRQVLLPSRSANGQLGEPNEVAEGALWLLSDAASVILGVALPANGVFLLTWPPVELRIDDGVGQSAVLASPHHTRNQKAAESSLESRSRTPSRPGGVPNWRLYSRLNCVELP